MIHLEAGCDPNGWCWPSLDIDRPVIERYVDDPQYYYPFSKAVYAFAITSSGPVCQVYLPKQVSFYACARGWTAKLLRNHELAHCAGLVHEPLLST